MEIIEAFREFAFDSFGMDFPADIDTSGKQKRYKMPDDKGCARTGFVTFYLDSNPMAIFGAWKITGGESHKWFYRDQKELTKSEKEEFKKQTKLRTAANKLADEKRKKAAAVKAGDLWSLPDLGDINYQYLKKKGVQAHGVKFYSGLQVFDFFASDLRKEAFKMGEIKVYDNPIMIVPVQNCNNQLVSLQQISPDGKFKGFLPDGSKKGCYHVMNGHQNYIFVVEGYATGATLYELTGCTIYVAFDCGNLPDVCQIVQTKHRDAKKFIGSDNDRFTFEPVNNPGQTKAKEICEKLDFYNLCPDFIGNQQGTDWNDLDRYYSKKDMKKIIRNKIKILLR